MKLDTKFSVAIVVIGMLSVLPLLCPWLVGALAPQKTVLPRVIHTFVHNENGCRYLTDGNYTNKDATPAPWNGPYGRELCGGTK